MHLKIFTIFSIVALLSYAACAEFKIDRSVMSEVYWAIWNEAEQARIDADIEANRKADVSVEIDAPDGTEIVYEQLTHDFRFGPRRSTSDSSVRLN